MNRLCLHHLFEPYNYLHHLIILSIEAGTIGALGYVLLISTLLAKSWCLIQRPKEAPLTLVLGALGMTLTTAYLMVGLTHDVFYHQPVALLMAGVVGLILGYGAPELRPEKSAPNVSQ